MAELEIKTVDDLSKLVGWTIIKASLGNILMPNGVSGSGIVIRLSHPAAEKQIDFAILTKPGVALNGNMITVNTNHLVKAFDVEGR